MTSYMDEFSNARKGSFRTANEEELRVMLYLLDKYVFDEDSLEYYLSWVTDGEYERVPPAYIIGDMESHKQLR